MTTTMRNSTYSGTSDAQYVNIRGTHGETGEKTCDANFNVTGQDVMCTIESDVDIGEYLCLEWRTGGDDGWDIVQVSYKVLVRCDKILNHILNSMLIVILKRTFDIGYIINFS